MSEHTKEPWRFQEHFSNVYALSDGDVGLSIHIAKTNDAQVEGGHAEAEANARRIVDCVNAFAGLNPSALAGLIEAAENAIVPLVRAGNYFLADQLQTALANLRVDA